MGTRGDPRGPAPPTGFVCNRLLLLFPTIFLDFSVVWTASSSFLKTESYFRRVEVGIKLRSYFIPNPTSRVLTSTSDPQLPEVGRPSCVAEVQLRKVGRWKLRAEACGGDQPPQYVSRGEKCLKTRKNESFQGGKPPGRNARGNPWKLVGTCEGPRGAALPSWLVFNRLRCCFRLTPFVIFVAKSKCLAVRSWKLKTNFRRSAV